MLFAQEQTIVPNIAKNLSSYWNRHQVEKIFVTTDKTNYRPGETIWFRAFVMDDNLQPVAETNNKLFAKLYDPRGEIRAEGLFNLQNGVAICDLTLPKVLTKGVCFLAVYTSSTIHPEDVSITKLVVDPSYENQWLAETRLKDSISASGALNELTVVLKELKGAVQKNTTLRYQILNGKEVIQKGKLKTDGNGKVAIPFTLPTHTSGAPFVCQLSDNREEWVKELFLPTGLDSVFVNFYPEGGAIVPGTISKIGFTAFNKWGMPVDVEGILQNQLGQSIPVRTFARGLGLMALETKADDKYTLKITGKSGQGQSFKLPEISGEGVALTILKADNDFITVAITFPDQQKHPVALAITRGGTVHWSAEPEINKSGSIRIPAKSLPQGINLLSLFSEKGQLLASRLIYVEKFQRLNISIVTDKINLKAGETVKVKVQLTDETDQPLAGNIAISVADMERLGQEKPRISEEMLLGSFLVTPFHLISNAFKGGITQNTLLDVFLISNRLKDFDWTKITSENQNYPGLPREVENLSIEIRLTDWMKLYAQRENWLYREKFPDADYLSANPMLFTKAPKVFKSNTIAIDNQRKMLESASGILDVIKTMKQYRIINNQIVFSGSENSINYQGGALIVLDGQMLGTDVSNINSISPMDVDHINVSTNAMDIQKYTGLNSVGVIEIYTKRAKAPEEAGVTETVENYANGFRVPNIFPTEVPNVKNDKRTTLFWIPEKVSNDSGLVEFSVTASNLCTNFVVEITGTTKDGRLGSGKAVFSVTR